MLSTLRSFTIGSSYWIPTEVPPGQVEAAVAGTLGREHRRDRYVMVQPPNGWAVEFQVYLPVRRGVIDAISATGQATPRGNGSLVVGQVVPTGFGLIYVYVCGLFGALGALLVAGIIAVLADGAGGAGSAYVAIGICSVFPLVAVWMVVRQRRAYLDARELIERALRSPMRSGRPPSAEATPTTTPPPAPSVPALRSTLAGLEGPPPPWDPSPTGFGSADHERPND